jgi:hypothetical protein
MPPSRLGLITLCSVGFGFTAGVDGEFLLRSVDVSCNGDHLAILVTYTVDSSAILTDFVVADNDARTRASGKLSTKVVYDIAAWRTKDEKVLQTG